MNPDFYEDEVIEGFYVPSMLKKAWGAQMDILRETDEICVRHNIPYFADWGTLLAAIRHGGYIPWDDDLDISMKRRDYERFLRFAEKELPEGFKVMTFKNHPGHRFFVARIVGRPRICFEEDHLKRFHGFPYIAGIDLFVLDNVDKDRKKERLKSKKAEFVLAVADNIADGVTKADEAEEQLLQCEIYTGKKIDRRLCGEDLRVRMYELVEELFASVPDERADALVQMMPYGMYDHELFIPKRYYEKTVRLPYMDTSICVPVCYDAVMRQKFGDYMTVRKDTSGHDYPFFYKQHEDLLKVLDFEYPKYKACGDDLTRPCKRERGIKDAAREYITSLSSATSKIMNADDNDAAGLQKEAFEFGTLIESVYGEGYGPVPYLEELCELIYRAALGEDVEKEVSGCIKKLSESVEETVLKRRDAVFLPFSSKHWKTMEVLYSEYEKDDRFNESVIPIPYYYKEYDGSFSEEVFDPDSFPSDINIIDHKRVDIMSMHPEKLIIQFPYDEWNTVMSVPKEYYGSRLKKYTDELIYVPFFVTDDFTFEDKREYINMDHYACMPSVICADTVMLPSEAQKDVYIRKLSEFVNDDSDGIREVLDKKIKICPALRNAGKTGKEDVPVIPEDEKKTVVFFTTISFLAQYGQGAVEKIGRTLDVFEQSEDRIKVIWITQCCKEGLELLDKDTAEGFTGMKKRFTQLGIGDVKEDVPVPDNTGIMKQCDAYYGNPSSLAMEFIRARKPVMLMNVDV